MLSYICPNVSSMYRERAALIHRLCHIQNTWASLMLPLSLSPSLPLALPLALSPSLPPSLPPSTPRAPGSYTDCMACASVCAWAVDGGCNRAGYLTHPPSVIVPPHALAVLPPRKAAVKATAHTIFSPTIAWIRLHVSAAVPQEPRGQKSATHTPASESRLPMRSPRSTRMPSNTTPQT